eukprot:UN04910
MQLNNNYNKLQTLLISNYTIINKLQHYVLQQSFQMVPFLPKTLFIKPQQQKLQHHQSSSSATTTLATTTTGNECLSFDDFHVDDEEYDTAALYAGHSGKVKQNLMFLQLFIIKHIQ